MNIANELNRIDQYQEIPVMAASCQADFAMLAKIVRDCHRAGFVTDAGEVRKVLGTLPVMASGEMLGGTDTDECDEHLTVWARHPADGRVSECHGIPHWSELADWRVRAKEEDADGYATVFRVDGCYSTKTAAEAGRGEK